MANIPANPTVKTLIQGQSITGSFSGFTVCAVTAGTYAVLANSGYMSLEMLSNYGQNGSLLGGHVTHSNNDAITLSTGSLGHGLPYGIGIALSKKRKNLGGKVFIVMSDGECDEGTTWESALLAFQFKLDNLFVIIDRNGIQSLAKTEDTLQLEPLADKWKAFNWEVETVDGHSHSQLEDALRASSGPKCIIANTIKGKGVSFMEDSVLWHYRPPSELELETALKEIIGNSGSPVMYLDAPEFKTYWDKDAGELAIAVKKIGKVE
jgi:transketolase